MYAVHMHVQKHICYEAFVWCVDCSSVYSNTCFVHAQLTLVRSEGMLVLRSTCINMVLGTDMKKHFDIVSRFQVHIQPACFVLHVCDMQKDAVASGANPNVTALSGCDSHAGKLLFVIMTLYGQLHTLRSTLLVQSFWASHQSLREQIERQQEPQQHFVIDRISIRVSLSHLPSAAVGMTSCSADADKPHSFQDTSVGCT